MGKTSGKERLQNSIERRKRLNRERARRFYEKSKQNRNKKSALHRKTKNRILNKVRTILPSTPEKKASIIENLLDSPETRNILAKKGRLYAEEEEKRIATATVAINNVKEAVTAIKHKRNNDSRVAINVGISMLCGNKDKLQTSLSKELGITRRRIAMSTQHRLNALSKDTRVPWTFTKRKTRNDAIPEDHRKLAYDFWTEKDISRPTGNKRDVSRQQIGPHQYIEHEKQILEKTQTEAFLAFKQMYPNIEMGQRYFESCKPFYVVPARTKDRNSCCCRIHVEAQMLFKSCMRYRQTLTRNNEVQIFTHLTDLVNSTLCDKRPEQKYHENSCLSLKCNQCGTKNLLFLPEEKCKDTNTKVKWERFEYVSVGEKRKLQLVFKETSPGEMFEYFIHLLESYPAHQFRAMWQNAELKNLINNLLFGHVCCVHDYSENYTCQHQDQIQSLYYGQVQVSIHVTILHRHAIQEIDGEESTPESPLIVTEHLFVISPDKKHDSHSVHNCQEQVSRYLRNIGCTVNMMHEWTDGCASQYKSRHCFGDLSMSLEDFDFPVIRNYFETSHAKGPQDGAGANLKHKCDMAVIRREVIIQNARDLYQFLESHFKEPSPSLYQSHNVRLKRRVFFYVDQLSHNRNDRLFKAVKGIRTIHSEAPRAEHHN